MSHGERAAVVQPGLAILQILQVAVIVKSKVGFFGAGQPGVKQTVHIVYLRLRWIIDRYWMLNAAADE